MYIGWLIQEIFKQVLRLKWWWESVNCFHDWLIPNFIYFQLYWIQFWFLKIDSYISNPNSSQILKRLKYIRKPLDIFLTILYLFCWNKSWYFNKLLNNFVFKSSFIVFKYSIWLNILCLLWLAEGPSPIVLKLNQGRIQKFLSGKALTGGFGRYGILC